MPARLPPSSDSSDRNYVTALARGLDVLSCFRSGEKLLGNQDIAKRCGLPKSTVSRLTYTLTTLGYLIHVPSEGKYPPGHGHAGAGQRHVVGAGCAQAGAALDAQAQRHHANRSGSG